MTQAAHAEKIDVQQGQNVRGESSQFLSNILYVLERVEFDSNFLGKTSVHANVFSLADITIIISFLCTSRADPLYVFLCFLFLISIILLWVWFCTSCTILY